MVEAKCKCKSKLDTKSQFRIRDFILKNSAQQVGFFNIGSGRVLDKIPGSGSGSGRVGVSKNTIGYFRVSFFLSCFFSDDKLTARAQRVGFFNIGSGRVLDKIPGSGSGRVG